ncbi:unnamed protein product [Urochloa humidicola]
MPAGQEVLALAPDSDDVLASAPDSEVLAPAPDSETTVPDSMPPGAFLCPRCPGHDCAAALDMKRKREEEDREWRKKNIT